MSSATTLASRPELDADVAIVGCGPVGTLLAILLGQKGHRVVLLDKWPTPYQQPRAVTFDHEIARILAMLGIDSDNDPAIDYHDDLYFWTHPFTRLKQARVSTETWAFEAIPERRAGDPRSKEEAVSPEEVLAQSGNSAWMLISASLVLLMTPALAFFYGGMSRSKSVLNMMMMSFSSIAVVTVIYFLWGWSMSYGTQDIAGIFANPFEFFALRDSITDADGLYIAGAAGYPNIIDVGFQVTFAIITVALISGAVAERVKFTTWLIFAGAWATLVYFPLAHMVWGGGLLSGSENSFAAWIFGTVEEEGELTAAVHPIDFAGGTVVHINAGMAALVLALIIGPRLGFGKTAYRPHNLPFVMLGAALLWFGWFGFNAGSAFAADGSAGLAWVNTTAATASAIIGWLIVEKIRDGHATSLGAASGIVAGLVAITPAAGSLSPLGSMILGVTAGALSALAVGLKFKFGYDDSLDVVGVHLVAGLWGTVAIGFLATETGLFYGGGIDQLIIQIVIALVALIFTAVMTVIIALALKPLGWRVGREEEESGIDGGEHAETAYELG